MPPAFHAMAVSILTGLFFFTVIAAVVRAVLSFRGADPTSKLAVASDLSALWAATIGWVVVFGAIITGFTIWSPSAVTNSPVMRNKILAAVLLLATYGVFLAMRWLLGARLWENKVLAAFAAFVALAGFHWGMITNSIGGDIAGIPSGYETLVRLTGVETRFTYYLPTWLLIVVVVVSVALLVLAFLPNRKVEKA